VKQLDAGFPVWCRYHLPLVDYIFIWIDDPAELETQYIPRHDRLIVGLGCQDHKESVHGTLMHRQDRNTEQALLLCQSMHIDWLLHIDADELLYARNKNALSKLWQSLCSSDIGQVTFLNHEVCPVWECGNVFQDCTYFKLNGQHRFNFYNNGKSAVRCGPGVSVISAHGFRGFTGKHVWCRNAFVLHYACATFEYWRRKYDNLKEFPDGWWDNLSRPIEFPFHLQSRDVYCQCLKKGDLSNAYEFFATQVLSEGELARLVAQGKVGRFTPLEMG
jgi:Glycosyl transferase family 2